MKKERVLTDMPELMDAVDNYYQYNPDTLMPLLLLTLSVRGILRVSDRPVKGETVLCSIETAAVRDFEWVRQDPKLKKRIKAAIHEGCEMIAATAVLPEEIADVYDTFNQYDNFTVDQEYHHRIGILYHHSSSAESDKAHRRYAMLCLAETLISTPTELVRDNFIELANRILVLSGLQPARPRLQVAQALNTLLNYRHDGVLYNPFTGCAMAAAMTGAGDKLVADGDSNNKLRAAARLLCYGATGTCSGIKRRDSTKWTTSKAKYVLSTYAGFVQGESAFDFCLSRCLDTFRSGCRYAGMVSAREIFEDPSTEFKEALRRDWVDTIVLMPFGEAAVLVDSSKESSRLGNIRFFDLTHPMLRNMPVTSVLEDEGFASVLNVRDVRRKGYLRSLVVPDIPEIPGLEIVTLGDFIKPLRWSTFPLTGLPEEERVLAYVDRRQKYNVFRSAFMQGIEKKTITSLFAPAYHMTSDCLITNEYGDVEPRIYEFASGPAFFQDGLAFEITAEDVDRGWLAAELRQTYVQRQLHPYGMDLMVPEKISEEQILSLQLYRSVESQDYEDDTLPEGYELRADNIVYTINKYLNSGAFGHVYTASTRNIMTGEKRQVVLKEFFPEGMYYREDGRGNVFEDVDEELLEADMNKFREEARIMNMLGNIPDSHIVPAGDVFESEDTGTMFYSMPYFPDGSLDNLITNGFDFSEDLVIKQVVIPMCKALRVGQDHKVLHLDIKPTNVLVDGRGDAILIDFGIAKQFDESGRIIDRRGRTSRSAWTPPEVVLGNVMKYDPRPDIFGLAGTIYTIVTKQEPSVVMELDDVDGYMSAVMQSRGYSPQFASAVVAGLQGSLNKRTADAQRFLNLFPGCEGLVI